MDCILIKERKNAVNVKKIALSVLVKKIMSVSFVKIHFTIVVKRVNVLKNKTSTTVQNTVDSIF